jgi:hypothetical protein
MQKKDCRITLRINFYLMKILFKRSKNLETVLVYEVET